MSGEDDTTFALEELGLLPGSWREYQRARVGAPYQPQADPRVQILTHGLTDLSRQVMTLTHQQRSAEDEYYKACGVIDQLRVLLGHLREVYSWDEATGQAIDWAIEVAEPFDQWGGAS